MRIKYKTFTDDGLVTVDVEKKIAGMTAICDFSMAPQMVELTTKLVDVMVLRFDEINGDIKIWNECIEAASDVQVFTVKSSEKWNRWNWREDQIRQLDGYEPDYVLSPDEDETYGIGFQDDFNKFIASEADIMMFGYSMVTEDNRKVNKYPDPKHCKAFRWERGIGYKPYKYCAKPTFFNEREPVRYNALTMIQHYCFYTKEMEESKILHK